MHRNLRIVIAAAILGGLAACKEETPVASQVRPVRTVVVEPKSMDDERQAVGEIRPRQESDLGFRVSGKLIVRSVDAGDSVNKGDVLARLDEEDYRKRLKSAESDLNAAEAVLAEARLTEGRQRQLLASGSTTRANHDAALKNLRSAQAQRENADVALGMAGDQLDYTALETDYDGIVTATGAELGQVVNIGQMIVRVARQSEKDAVFSVAEQTFQDQSLGARPAVVVSLLSNPEIKAEGVVREVSPVADPATRTYQVKAMLNGAPQQMMFGSSVTVRLKAVVKDAVVIPGSAIFDKAGQPAVWLYQHATKTVTLREVKVTRYDTDRVVVAEGLNKGDVVVTAGVNRLREGEEVRLAGEH